MDLAAKCICIKVFDFSTDDHLEEKLRKFQKLEELDALVRNSPDSITDQYIIDLFEIIEENLFRPLPVRETPIECINIGPNFEQDTNQEDPQMIHLQPVYQLLYDVLVLLRNNFSKSEIAFLVGDEFVKNLLLLIDSRDAEEQNHVKECIEFLYVIVPEFRPLIARFVTAKLDEIIGNGTNGAGSLIHMVNNLLGLYYLVGLKPPTPLEPNTIRRRLLGLFRLPFLYYYYVRLFTVMKWFLTSHPEHIVEFTRSILGPNRVRGPSITSNAIMTLIALSHILDIILSMPETVRPAQWAAVVLPNILEWLKSRNAEIVMETLRLLTKDRYMEYFDENIMMISSSWRNKFLTILADKRYALPWDYRTHVQQVLYQLYLRSKSNPNSSS